MEGYFTLEERQRLEALSLRSQLEQEEARCGELMEKADAQMLYASLKCGMIQVVHDALQGLRWKVQRLLGKANTAHWNPLICQALSTMEQLHESTSLILNLHEKIRELEAMQVE